MGSARKFNVSGGFAEYLYETIGKERIVNGIHAKVVKLKTDESGTHSSLPQYANSSDMYLRLGYDGVPCQAKLYVSRRMCIDFDWGHDHKNSDGKSFPKGVVHIQTYSVNSVGTAKRKSDNARYMSEREINMYGDVLMAFNPNIKFRP